MSGFQLQPLGLVMEPEPGNPQEVEGVLNPGAVRGPDGKIYLFARLLRGAIIRALALPGFYLMRPATRPELNGSALRSSPRLITSGDPMVAAAVNEPVSS